MKEIIFRIIRHTVGIGADFFKPIAPGLLVKFRRVSTIEVETCDTGEVFDVPTDALEQVNTNER